MALNTHSSAIDPTTLQEKDAIFESKKDSSSGRGSDPEKASHSPAFQPKSGRRIAPVLPHLKNYDFGSDDSGDDDILGRQILMESENAIKYRTCSWQKVCSPYERVPIPCIFFTQFCALTGG